MRFSLSNLTFALCVALAGGYATIQIVDYSQERGKYEFAVAQLSAAHEACVASANDLAQQIPERVELKTLVQECGAKYSVPIVYLTETQKDVAGGSKEQSISCRATNVAQQKLILCLAEIEARGQGARIRDIRIKQSPEQADVFQEAEIMVSICWPGNEQARK